MVTVLNFSEQHYNDVFRQALPAWFAATTSSLNAEQSCYFSFLVEQYDSKIKKSMSIDLSKIFLDAKINQIVESS